MIIFAKMLGKGTTFFSFGNTICPFFFKKNTESQIITAKVEKREGLASFFSQNVSHIQLF